MLVDWLDIHAGAIQALSSIVMVLATGVLVWVTWTYAKAAKQQAEQAERQVEQIQQQRFDQFRPVVQPVGRLLLTEDHQVDLSKSSYDLLLQNVGTGVALTVCGVLFPPKPEGMSGSLPRQYTVWRESAILPNSGDLHVTAKIGITKMNGNAMIGEYQLFAPSKPSLQEWMKGGKYNIPARLALTYEDIFRRKHAAIFDYIDLYGWQCVALLPDIREDLEDIDKEACRAMQPVRHPEEPL